MKYFELDQEEKDLLDAVERGEYKSVPNAKKEIERYRTYFTRSEQSGRRRQQFPKLHFTAINKDFLHNG
jgi:hypothetical protein